MFRLMKQGPFLLCLCHRGAFTDFQRIFSFCCSLEPEAECRMRPLAHKWRKPSPSAGKPPIRKNDLSARPNRFGQTDKPYFLMGGLPGFTLPAMFLFFFSFPLFVDFSLKPFPESASTSVYLHFRAFQYAASGSHFRSGRKGNSGI